MEKQSKEITVFLTNKDILVVERIEPSKFCGSPHYVCTKGQAKIYIPYGKVDFIRVEKFEDTENENSPAP